MNRAIVPILFILSAQEAFSGGSMGGSPPSSSTIMLSIPAEEFQSIAVDALLNPDRQIFINGTYAIPTSIDLKSRVMSLETKDSKVIEIKELNDTED